MRAAFLLFALAAAAFAQPVILTRHQTTPTALLGGPSYTWSRMWGFDCAFYAATPKRVTLSGHVNLAHRGLCVGAVGFVLKAFVRGPATTEAGLDAMPAVAVYGSKISGNIRDIEAHYAEVPLHGYFEVSAPGWYRVEIWGNSHSSASSYSGLIEVNAPAGTPDPYNQLLIRIEDVAP